MQFHTLTSRSWILLCSVLEQYQGIYNVFWLLSCLVTQIVTGFDFIKESEKELGIIFVPVKYEYTLGLECKTTLLRYMSS